MKASEMQRTLVKSPPELWAELSDPGSLARHLGELGEIRITGLEPESRVEWEGEGLSGTVALKPSGWGTKVTLTVTRTPGAIAVPPATGGEGGGEAPADAADENATAAQAPADTADDYAAAADTPAETRDEGAWALQGPPEIVDREQEQESGLGRSEPATAPGEPHAAAGLAHDDAEAPAAADTGAVGVEGLAVDGVDEQERSDPSDPAATPAASEHTALREPDTEERRADPPPESEQMEAPPTRRGFFAKLLDRWRRSEQGSVAELPHSETAERPAAAAVPPPTLSALLAAETAAALSRRSQPPADGNADCQAEAAGEPEAEPGPPAEPAVDPEHLAEAPAPEPEPDAIAEVDPPPSDPAGRVTRITGPRPVAALDAPDSPPDADPARPEGEPGAQPSAAAPDLSAELLAAEQSEEEQLRAILTGVLDRLGAAHHRPFSRA